MNLTAKETFLSFDDYQLKVTRIYSNSPKVLHPPTIVFLHDSLGCTTLWRDFPERLVKATGCNALIYDRRGYGGSSPVATVKREVNYMEKEADLLADILKKSSVEQAILFGHSDGATIALITAARYPQLVQAALVEGPHVFVEEITLKGIKEAVNAYYTTEMKQKLMKYHGDKTEAVVQTWEKIWQSPEFRNWNIEYLLPKIQCPIMIIQGEEDQYGTEKQVSAIAEQVTSRTVVALIPNIGHTPHKENPDWTLSLSSDFIDDLLMDIDEVA